MKKISWFPLIFYLALLGSYCGLELDTYVEDLPFFQISTLLLFVNVLWVLMLPPLLYGLFASIRSLWSARIFRIPFLILNSIYFHLVILLLLYKAGRDMDFDFYFFWYNLTVALSVLWRLYAPALIGIVLSLTAFVFLQNWIFSPVRDILKQNSRKTGSILAAIAIASMLCQLATLNAIRGSAAGFLYASFLSDRELRTEYREFYEEHIKGLQSKGILDMGGATPSAMGDTVIFVQQESLNSYLVSHTITPQLLRASQNGILLNSLYGNSIQSERGYECILCGVPPSLAGDLVEDYSREEIGKLNCLPRIFKELGYHPIVFYSGNPNPRVKRLFEAIGFEKILADEIMQPGDVLYDWGYREDIFFTRVDEYLQKHSSNDKRFIFITASATNHTPFKVQDIKYRNRVPFPNPQKFEERLSNTTFVQDSYFGGLYDIYTKHYAQSASLIAVSDHAWPLPFHRHNIYNERGAFEENFRIALLFIPPSNKRKEFAVGTVVTQRFSQMDILPTVLDVLGVRQNSWLGESFAPWLLASRIQDRHEPRKTKMSIQPYGGGFISVVQYPQKYLFDVMGQNVRVFDLKQDPKEQFPAVQAVGPHMGLIRDFFGRGLHIQLQKDNVHTGQ